MNAPLHRPSEPRQRHQAPGETRANPNAGFFNPRRAFWKVSREAVVYLGGMRALLMQIAHPKVAQGVADHSRFREDPFGRARRTFEIVHTVVFGTRGEALRATERLRAIHAKVRGRLSEPVPGHVDPAYAANDPQLLFWVYATLVDSSLHAYSTFLPPLTCTEREEFYQESKVFARLMGIGDEYLPPRLADFQHWLADALAGDTLTITTAAREVATTLLTGPWYFALLRPANVALAAGMLPPKLRQAFGLPWNRGVRVTYAAGVNAVRLLARLTPAGWRVLRVAKRAEKHRADISILPEREL
jgi:uncharacterized protein (DUF2236 family)